MEPDLTAVVVSEPWDERDSAVSLIGTCVAVGETVILLALSSLLVKHLLNIEGGGGGEQNDSLADG